MEFNTQPLINEVASMSKWSLLHCGLRWIPTMRPSWKNNRHVFPSGMFLPIHEDAPEGDNMLPGDSDLD
jgi:hypothetical protein